MQENKTGELQRQFSIMPLLYGRRASARRRRWPRASHPDRDDPMHTLEQLRAGELCGARHLKLAENLTVFPSEILNRKRR